MYINKNMVNNISPDTQSILNELNKGAKLYYNKGCGACHNQMQRLGLTFDDIKNIKGAIDCENKNKCKDIEGIPTWVNKHGDKLVGSQDPSAIKKMLTNKQSNNMKFGKIYSNLNQQPQFIGSTSYCSVPGGALPWSSKKISNLPKRLKHYQDMGPFIGTNNTYGLHSFGSPTTLGNSLKSSQPLNPGGISNSLANKNGARLPRPYGPRDSTRMVGKHLAGSLLPPFDLDWNYAIGQFGKRRRRSKRKSKRKSRRRSHKFSRRRNKRHTSKPRRRRSKRKSNTSKRRRYRSKRRTYFGMTTPGTKAWNNSRKGMLGLEWVHSKFKPAKGYNPNPALLYLPIPNSQKISIPQDIKINVPMQYTNNQFNNPIPQSKVNKFGKDPSLVQMEGPNIVAYEPNMNLYDGAGANTINWATGKTFRPKGKSLLKIQRTKQNPRGFLSNSKNIKKASTGFNIARSYTNKGLKYGQSTNNLIYTRDLLQSNAKTLYQPKPPYMQDTVSGSYATFGKKKKKKLSKFNKLSHQFGGKVITLDPTGKITITRPSNKK